jgi:hypothetical protein
MIVVVDLQIRSSVVAVVEAVGSCGQSLYRGDGVEEKRREEGEGRRGWRVSPPRI